MSEATIKMVLEGAFASWCVDLPKRYRPTNETPSRDAIVGLIACALGRTTDDPNHDLEGIQIVLGQWSIEGVVEDYHTISNAITYGGKPGRNAITHREYVTNPRYEIYVTGPSEVINMIAEALSFPRWPLYLGRKACVPSRPVFDSFVEAPG